MPKFKEGQLPSYRLHKQSGQAVVTLPAPAGLRVTSASTWGPDGSGAQPASVRAATRRREYLTPRPHP